MSVVCRIIHLHAQSASVSIVKPGWLLIVVHMKQSLLVLMLNTLAGGDWSSSPTVPKFPDVHLNVNCAVNCPLAVFLVYLTATDTCLYWSRLLPTARQVKWWSSSVVTTDPTSPSSDMSRWCKLELIAPPSGREQPCDVAGFDSRSTTKAKSAKTIDAMTRLILLLQERLNVLACKIAFLHVHRTAGITLQQVR